MSRPKLSNLDVAQVLEDFIEGTGGRWDWDDFLSVAELSNHRLEQIRHHCNRLSDEFPPAKRGYYCNEQGIEVMRRYVAELRSQRDEGE